MRITNELDINHCLRVLYNLLEANGIPFPDEIVWADRATLEEVIGYDINPDPTTKWSFSYRTNDDSYHHVKLSNHKGEVYGE